MNNRQVDQRKRIKLMQTKRKIKRGNHLKIMIKKRIRSHPGLIEDVNFRGKMLRTFRNLEMYLYINALDLI